MKEIFLYTSTSGHTIVSPINLDYAMNAKTDVDLGKIESADFSKINLLADPIMARTVKSLLEEKKWRSAEDAIDHPTDTQANWEGDVCVIKDGILYIRNGKKYITVNSLIAKSDKDTLAVALRYLANQAATCQATLVHLLCEKDSETE